MICALYQNREGNLTPSMSMFHLIYLPKGFKPFIIISLLFFILLGCQSPSSSSLDSSSLGTSKYPILGGTNQPNTVTLESNHFWSFGWIHPVEDQTDFTCSGVLISPVHFLTSANCLTPYHHRFLGITFDPNPHLASEPFYADLRSAVQHPTLDVAVIELIKTPSAYAKPFNLLPPQWDEMVFKPGSEEERALIRLDSVGIHSNRLNQGNISFLNVVATPLDQNYFQLNAPQGGELCFGDAGGPVLWQSTTSEWPFIVGLASKPSPTSNRQSSCQGPQDMLRIDSIRPWIESVLNQEQPTVCRLNSLYCDGLFLHSCPFGREVISECPELLLCDEAQEHLTNNESFDERTIMSLRQIEECNRPPSSGFWNEDIAPPPSRPNVGLNQIEGEEGEMNSLDEMQQGCMQGSNQSLSLSFLIFLILCGTLVLQKAFHRMHKTN